ncbi:ADP-ribose diphosphatase [Psychrosphaera ytuae]|uniref:ADP-ribose pyrophosphatase n=1 Tax=Psychrosphaera ytuae TaxID=2820710 RepID=A0A975HJ58_9GAMM|nr:ADP-ribose diphosphatase [Psychrosphaera ytuae]QTH64966.1 ADP-ribose diphosphatase [Psychrosphaera ytuae]
MTQQKYTPVFNSKNVEIKSIERAFDGFFKINTFTFRHAKFAGGQSDWVQREIFERGHAVGVLPYDPSNQKVVLIEQIRIGALATKDSPWLLEIIAGMVDKESEQLEEVAIREAQEEANLVIDELTPMLSYLSSPGGTTERLYLYLAEVNSEDAGGIFGLDTEHEDIKVHVLDVDHAFELLDNGVIDNAAAVIALQWLRLKLVKEGHNKYV